MMVLMVMMVMMVTMLDVDPMQSCVVHAIMLFNRLLLGACVRCSVSQPASHAMMMMVLMMNEGDGDDDYDDDDDDADDDDDDEWRLRWR